MFEEYFEEPDCLDCILDLHSLKESSRNRSDEDLVADVIETTLSVQIEPDKRTNEAIKEFYNKGKLSHDSRIVIENCYVLLNNSFCISEEGDIYTMRFR